MQTIEWMNEDLISKMKTNSVLVRGLSNPRCLQVESKTIAWLLNSYNTLKALELMKTNPNEAIKRYQHDEHINEFLREFGKVMSQHFEELGMIESLFYHKQQHVIYQFSC
jgi:hypothetical protein